MSSSIVHSVEEQCTITGIPQSTTNNNNKNGWLQVSHNAASTTATAQHPTANATTDRLNGLTVLILVYVYGSVCVCVFVPTRLGVRVSLQLNRLLLQTVKVDEAQVMW